MKFCYCLKDAKHDYYRVAMCPFCGDVKEEELLQADDYVYPCPMTWCYTGDCQEYSVLLEDNAQIIDKSELPEKLQAYMDKCKDELIPYKIPLAKVLKIMNRQFYDFKFKDNSHSGENMTEADMRKMIELSPGLCNDPSEEFKAFLNKWGLIPKDDEDQFDYEYPGDDLDFTFHLPVNSYDVFGPETPFPENFDLAHDGIYIYLQCLDADGKQFIMTFWGD